MIVRALTDPMHEIERCLAALERACTRRRIRDVSLHPVHCRLALSCPRCISRQAPYAPAFASERRSCGATDETRCSGQKQRAQWVEPGHQFLSGDPTTWSVRTSLEVS